MAIPTDDITFLDFGAHFGETADTPTGLAEIKEFLSTDMVKLEFIKWKAQPTIRTGCGRFIIGHVLLETCGVRLAHLKYLRRPSNTPFSPIPHYFT
jgi:hypothetical protein